MGRDRSQYYREWHRENALRRKAVDVRRGNGLIKQTAASDSPDASRCQILIRQCNNLRKYGCMYPDFERTLAIF